MNLFVILISDGGIIRGTHIGSQYNAIFVNEAYDGGSRFGCEGQDGLVGVGGCGLDEGIAVDVVEGESAGRGVGVDPVGGGEFRHD